MMEDNTFYQENKSSFCKTEENYKMVIIVREDLKMGKGKIAAQVGHGGNI
jgi:hypothetical protein